LYELIEHRQVIAVHLHGDGRRQLGNRKINLVDRRSSRTTRSGAAPILATTVLPFLGQ
jgi:hypothetical protein